VEKRRKKEHKKRKKERNERKKEESRTPLSKAEKTQRQGCELNQHSTFSSPSPSSSPQRARRKEKEQRTGVAIVFSVPRSSDHRLCAEAAVPLSSSISVTREGEKENTEDGTEEEKKREKAQEKRKTIN
jgi:hypothetical protein